VTKKSWKSFSKKLSLEKRKKKLNARGEDSARAKERPWRKKASLKLKSPEGGERNFGAASWGGGGGVVYARGNSSIIERLNKKTGKKKDNKRGCTILNPLEGEEGLLSSFGEGANPE